jgi:mannitol-1-/sugar-/sorbitol-6-phosphatase
MARRCPRLLEVTPAPPPPLLFDLDGTLVDSSVVVERHWGIFAQRHRLALDPILAVCHGRRTADTIAEVASWLDAEQEAATLDAGEESDIDGLRPVTGASELLTALDRGRWAVVTSAHRRLAVRRLEAVALPVPDVLVCGDEVEGGKPDPEGFLRAARLLAVSPTECVVVEDSPAGIEAGRRAGAYVIALTTTHRREALAAVADVVVDDLRGLAGALAEICADEMSGTARSPPAAT